MTPAAKASAVNDIRGSLLQVIGGVALIAGDILRGGSSGTR